MDSVVDNLKKALGRLTTRQRVQLVLSVVAVAGLLWGFTTYANRVRYGVLFSNMERDDASAVIAELKERGVPHRTAAGGTLIEVPVERIDELRLDLAGEGLPMGGGVGFELFDKPAFGLSDFVQNVNYRRALERELARTIQDLAVVRSARVHLALPPEAVFADETREPSASVVVALRSGRTLSADRVRAITNLVASGVEGLDPARVSVIDGEGRMLSSGHDTEDSMLSDSQLEAKADREAAIERNLIAILEPIVGAGRVRARASVELNMRRVERVEETFDPEGAVVLSETKSKEKNGSGNAGGGVPGSQSNLPGAAGATGGNAGGTQESQQTVTNFEISKTVSTVSEPVGGLVRQSVAVVIDHAPVAADGDGTPVARSPNEMQQITQIVQASIGYDADRGDVVTVENVPFEMSPVLDSGGGMDVVGLLTKLFRFGSLPLAVLLLVVLVFRPAIAAIRDASEGAPPAVGDGGPPTVAQLQAQVQAQLAGGGAEGGTLALGGDTGSPMRRKLIEAVGEDPQAAALVIRSWLSNEGGKKAKEA